MDRELLINSINTKTITESSIDVRDFIQNNQSQRDYHFVNKHINKIKTSNSIHERISILSSFTFDQIKDYLPVELFAYGMLSKIHVAGYNQYAQELLNPKSDTYSFNPTIIILAIRLEDLYPNFFLNFKKQSIDVLESEIDKVLRLFDNLINSLRKHSNATLFINGFTKPFDYDQGLYDSQCTDGQNHWINKINDKLKKLIIKRSSVYFFDLDNILSKNGYNNSMNLKMWYVARIPFSSKTISYISKSYKDHIYSIKYRKKCLVLDLDNTLWGGIIGEDGLNGIALGDDYPGNIYVEIQRKIKQFANQGVILALNSKNNEKDAKEVFENHESCFLKWDDFAATRVNWNPKNQNIEELANELNIGINSMVFIDDNPAEIQIVKSFLPQVEVVQFSKDPITNLELIRKISWFNSLSITEDDIKKTEQYKTQVKRSQLKNSVSDIEDYYRALEMKMDFSLTTLDNVRRVSQLTQKNNQFNCTTKRYSEIEINDFLNSDIYDVYHVTLIDKFGNNGITGVTIIKKETKSWYIDTFLLSCRIIGRTVETAILSSLLDKAKKSSVKELIGSYIPTEKNILVKDLFKNHNFSKIDGNWIINSKSSISFPTWITLI